MKMQSNLPPLTPLDPLTAGRVIRMDECYARMREYALAAVQQERAEKDELLDALAVASQVIGHPDDDFSKLLQSILAKHGRK